MLRVKGKIIMKSKIDKSLIKRHLFNSFYDNLTIVRCHD